MDPYSEFGTPSSPPKKKQKQNKIQKKEEIQTHRLKNDVNISVFSSIQLQQLPKRQVAPVKHGIRERGKRVRW